MTRINNNERINWSYPAPRKGVLGSWDKFVGPGASKAELFLILVPPIIFSVFVIFYASKNHLQWTIWQNIIAFFLAFDISGGITTNTTSCAKRWYHRKGQNIKHHIIFVSIHILQIALVAFFFRSGDITYMLTLYLPLTIGAILILTVPQYIQRSVAGSLTSLAVLLSIYNYYPPTDGFEWFDPFLYIKIFISHLTLEEPYAKK